MPTTYFDNEKITTNFPNRKFNSYLKKLDLKSSEKLTLSDRHNILMRILDDFKSGKVCLDELSEMSDYLWSTIHGKRDGELEIVLLEAAELSYYLRIITKDYPGNFIMFLNDILDYYQKYKKKQEKTANCV